MRLPVTAAEKVKFVDAELAATLNKLDDMIAGLTGPRTEIDDPDGLVRFTLSDDERLLSLFIDDAVRTSLNNLGLDKKRDDRFAPAMRQCGCSPGAPAIHAPVRWDYPFSSVNWHKSV